MKNKDKTGISQTMKNKDKTGISQTIKNKDFVLGDVGIPLTSLILQN
jgi:hypothetical protein